MVPQGFLVDQRWRQLTSEGDSGQDRYFEALSKWKFKVMIHSRAVALALSCNQNHLKGLLKHRLLGPASRVFDSVGLRWDSGIFISNKFPSNTADTDPWISLETCCQGIFYYCWLTKPVSKCLTKEIHFEVKKYT